MSSRHRAPKLAFPTNIKIFNNRVGAHSSFAMRKNDSTNQAQIESQNSTNNSNKELITTVTSDGSLPKKLILSNSSEFNSLSYDDEKSNLYTLNKESEQSFSYLSDVSDETESSFLPQSDSSICISVPPFPQILSSNLPQREIDNSLSTELDEYYKKSIYVLNEDEESKEYEDKLAEFDINDLWLDSVAQEIFENDYPEFLDDLQNEIDYNTFTSALAAKMTDEITKDKETIELLKENPISESFKTALTKQRDNALSEEDYEKEMSSLYKFNIQNYSAEELNQQWGFKNPQIGKYIAKYRKQLFVPG